MCICFLKRLHLELKQILNVALPLLFFLTIVTLSSNPDYGEISILLKHGPDMTSVVEKN